MSHGGDRNRPTPPDDGELDASALESVPPMPAAAPLPPPAPSSSARSLGGPVAIPRAAISRPRDPRTGAPPPAPRAPKAGLSVPPPAPSTKVVTQPPPKAPSVSPPRVSDTTPPTDRGPWPGAVDRIAREVDARATREPTRAALLLAAQARISLDMMSDPMAATHALSRASELADGARFVASTWRWLAEQGADPIAVLQRTRAELAHVGDGRERTALLWQVASIEEHVVGDVASAMRTVRELLTLEPSPGAWDALGALYLRSKTASDQWDSAPTDDVVFGGVIETLDVMAHTTDDGVMRSALHGAAGALRDRYLGDIEGALASLRRGLEADQTNAGAQATLEAILLRRRSWDEYARVISAQADRTAEPLAAREHYERAGDVYAECVGDHARAAHCYVRAATLAETDPGPVEKLAFVLIAGGRWEDAAAAYERLLARLRDPIQKAWTLLRLGLLTETRLHRPDDALTAYRLAVDAAPTFAPAVQALLRATRERGLALAIELERREADRIADPNVRAIHYAALAERVEDATPSAAPDKLALQEELYARALKLDPTNSAAFDALDRMYRAGAHWPRLVALYETALTYATHPRKARALQLELAELHQSRMNQPSRAAELLREALAGPDDRFGILVTLGRAFAAAGRWTDFVEALDAQAGMLTGVDEIAALYRIGSVLETQVKDLRRALATYELVLDRAPHHEAAARGVVRIHTQEERWDHVIEGERRLLDLATRPEDVIEGLIRIARVSEEQLGRLDEAIGAYAEAFERAPAYAPVVTALERLLRAAGNYRRLAQILQRFADATLDVDAKVRARLRAATVLELCMDDTDTASTAYARALAEASSAPGDSGATNAHRQAALWGLLRLQETRGEWESVDHTLQRILETTSENAARKRVLVRLARNAELRLDDLPRAAHVYNEALAIALSRGPAGLAVDRVRIARIEGHRDAVASCVGAMAASTTDKNLEDGLVRVLALASEHSGMGSRAVEQAANLYEQLVARDPEDPQALDGLVRCVAASSFTDTRLARALIARSRATTDMPLRALLAFAAGVLDEGAGRTSDAEVAYAFSLLADPELVPALDAARRLRSEVSDWDAVASLAERSARASLDRENAAESWLEAAEVYENRLSDPGRALTCYRALLAVHPAHVHALERALALFENAADYAGAVGVLVAHADALTDPIAQSRIFVRRANILAGRLGDTSGAIVDLRRALALNPADEDAKTMQALAVLEERARNWQEALRLNERIASTNAASKTARRRARLAQARIYGDELRDDVKAKAILEELIVGRPDDRDAVTRLAEVSARSGYEARALELYEQLATTGGSVERVRALVARAELQISRPDATSKAEGEAALARAFDLAIADPSVISTLEDRIAKDGDWRSYAAHAEAAVSRVPPNTPGVLPMRTAVARVLRDELGNHDAADRQLAATIQAFPESMETRIALATSLMARNADAALVELRRAVAADPTAAAPFEALVKLARKTGRTEIAVMLASAAAVLGGTSPDVESTLANATPIRPLPDSLLYEEAMLRLVGPTRARFLRTVLVQLEPFLHKIFPGGETMLETRARLPDSYPIAADVRAISSALGVVTPMVCRGVGREVVLLLTEPRALVLGNDLLSESGRSLCSFHAAYACARMAANGSMYVAPRQQAVALLDAATLPDADGPAIRDLRKRVSSALPRKTKKDLERIVAEGGGDLHAEFAAWEAEESRRALHAAVILSRDVRAVAQILAADALAIPRVDDRRKALAANMRLRELLEFVVSPACWDVFMRVYGHP